MLKKIFALALVLTLTGLCTIARADTPRETVEKSVSAILGMIMDPAFKNPATKVQMRQKIENEVLHFFDFEEFSTRTVGAAWRDFSPEQKQRFITAFTDLLRNTYIDKLDAFNGGQMVYTGEIADDSGNKVEVQAQLQTGGQSYPFAFRLLQKNGKWVVYDVLIEGISLIKNYRDQFRDIMAKGSPEELIQKVEAKAAEQLKKNS